MGVGPSFFKPSSPSTPNPASSMYRYIPVQYSNVRVVSRTRGGTGASRVAERPLGGDLLGSGSLRPSVWATGSNRYGLLRRQEGAAIRCLTARDVHRPRARWVPAPQGWGARCRVRGGESGGGNVRRGLLLPVHHDERPMPAFPVHAIRTGPTRSLRSRGPRSVGSITHALGFAPDPSVKRPLSGVPRLGGARTGPGARSLRAGLPSRRRERGARTLRRARRTRSRAPRQRARAR